MPTNEIELYQRLTKVEENVKSNQHRIDAMEELTKGVNLIANETKAMREDLNDVRDKVEYIENKPVKRFDGIVDKVIITVVGAVVGFILARMGL